jgi:hypothetical protein
MKFVIKVVICCFYNFSNNQIIFLDNIFFLTTYFTGNAVSP